MHKSADRTTKERPATVPPLENGERLTQAEFLRRYEACPDDVKFELIGGTVFMASPLRWPHANYHPKLSLALELYAAATPGVELGDNATTLLGEESAPQPDLALRRLPEYGGISRLNEGEYVAGAPELLAEIAHSSRSIDLGQKRIDYQQAGVVEYLVLCVEEREVHWFDFRTGRPLRPNREGVYRSRVFPGLWVHERALLERDTLRLMAVVQQGLASRAHGAFVKKLQAAHRKHASG